MSKNPFSGFLSYRFNLDEDKAEEEEIISTLRKNVEFKGTNLWALIFAIFIASIGLNVNSTAVIIGAMLISPIMGPIMGIGLGLGIFDSELIKLSLKNLFIAIIISLIASTVYFFISPLHEAQSELLARTRPTIWDVLIALFGGLAGVIASTRKNISNTVPGVAIATALMPPLCTAGYGLATGNLIYFLGAFYLFIINSVFISISTFLIIRFLNFKPVRMVDMVRQKKIRQTIWYVAVLTIIPSLYLAVIFVSEEVFKQKVTNFINGEIKPNGLYVLDRSIDPDKKKVTLMIYGAELSDSAATMITERRRHYGLDNAEVALRKAESINSKDLTRLRDDFQQELMSQDLQVSEKDQKIKALERELKNARQYQPPAGIYKEFESIYGQVKELSIHKTPVWSNNSLDTVVLVYIKANGKRNGLKETQISNWLQVRLNEERIRVIVE